MPHHRSWFLIACFLLLAACHAGSGPAGDAEVQRAVEDLADPARRQAAMQALALRMPGALEPVLDAMADPQRGAPARQVLLSAGATCVPQLLAAAAGEVPARRAAAAAILLELAKGSVPILVRIVGVEATRGEALQRLQQVEGEHLSLLIDSLVESPDELRRQAMPALERFAPAFVASAEHLVEGLRETSTRERSLVCLTIAGPPVVTVLLKARAHGVGEELLLRALQTMGPAAVPALQAQRESGDAAQQAFVARALGVLSGR